MALAILIFSEGFGAMYVYSSISRDHISQRKGKFQISNLKKIVKIKWEDNLFVIVIKTKIVNLIVGSVAINFRWDHVRQNEIQGRNMVHDNNSQNAARRKN